jgi:hypothetical protein
MVNNILKKNSLFLGALFLVAGINAQPAELLDRKYNEFAQVLVHNATSHDYEHSLVADQNKSFDEILNYGFRAFKLPLHTPVKYGRGSDVVWVAHLNDDLVKKVVDKIMDQPIVPNALKGSVESFVQDIMWDEIDLTKMTLADFLVKIKAFLEGNPKEIVTFFLDTHNIPDVSNAIYKVFKTTGVDKYLYTQDAEKEWPTLREMIKKNQRIVVFFDDPVAAGVPFMRDSDWKFENGYEYHSVAALEAEDCLKDFSSPAGVVNAASYVASAGPKNKFFKMNHFITKGAAGNRDEAFKANSYNSIMNSVKKCLAARGGMYPNFIHLDFVDQNYEDIKRVIADINDKLYTGPILSAAYGDCQFATSATCKDVTDIIKSNIGTTVKMDELVQITTSPNQVNWLEIKHKSDPLFNTWRAPCGISGQITLPNIDPKSITSAHYGDCVSAITNTLRCKDVTRIVRGQTGRTLSSTDLDSTPGINPLGKWLEVKYGANNIETSTGENVPVPSEEELTKVVAAPSTAKVGLWDDEGYLALHSEAPKSVAGGMLPGFAHYYVNTMSNKQPQNRKSILIAIKDAEGNKGVGQWVDAGGDASLAAFNAYMNAFSPGYKRNIQIHIA